MLNLSCRYLCRMDYFRKLLQLLQLEKEEDRKTYEKLAETVPLTDRRANGTTWYPIAIRDSEIGYGDYLSVEVERTSHLDIIHQFRFGMSVALFSQLDPKNNRIEGTLSFIGGNRMKIALRTDELPEWSRGGKLGVDVVFDQNSYEEMERTLKAAPLLFEKGEEGQLIRILTGEKAPSFGRQVPPEKASFLNEKQHGAVAKILEAGELAIVHGPPGTGKTTTLVQAIKAIRHQGEGPVLVVAPSNTAVDLLSEKLAAEGLNVVRIGNPARVSEQQMALTLDSRINGHSRAKDIKRLKKQAAEYRNLAHKYKRSFGREEREQRNALFAEARAILKEAERTEQYITDDVLGRADIITATLIGANHYSVRQLKYGTVVIDEAGQAMEPACWVPILKAKKLVMAGDHCQLPPTVKSVEAARQGLSTTLMEKCVALWPEAVVLLEEQYRMNQSIMGFPSDAFYQNRLKAHPSVAQRTLTSGDKPLLFIDTAGCGYEEVTEGTSISNPEEAAFLLRHLESLVTELRLHYEVGQFPSIAVISPYKHQVEVLKEGVLASPLLQEVKGSIAVNTIDSFQGQERDVVYISMTRSNTDSTIGFLSDVRRMNVAMTRAKQKLVVVGDSATLSQDDFYRNFITYTQEEAAYASAWEFLQW